MSMQRITQRSVTQSSLAGLQTNLSRLAKVQEQLSSGRVINRPSDSPSGTVTAMQLRSETRATEQFVRNAADGESWLSTIDNSLTEMMPKIDYAKAAGLQALNTGLSSAAAREALAAVVDATRAELLTDANTKYLGRPVFGGVTAGSDAYDSNGTYVGAAPPPAIGSVTPPAIVRTVAPGTEVRVDLTGVEVFESPTAGRNLFDVLKDVSAAIRNDSIGLEPLLGELDKVQQKMINGHADVGARSVRVSNAQQTAKDTVIQLTNSLTDVESTDVASAIVEMKLSEMSYQAALAATSRAIQPSLVDWLR